MNWICSLCRERKGENICKVCKRAVCDECFDSDLGMCLECITRKALWETTAIPKHLLTSAPILISILGFLLIIVGSFILFLSPFQGVNSVSGGTVFLLGPIPIILGRGPYAPLLVTLALLVTVLVMVIWLITGKTRMS